MSYITEAVKVVPSKRQLEWQKLEFYSFLHFGMNTFTGKEWGDGTDSPSLFDPTDFSADQNVESIKEGGMKGCILTCKHHDGFCLWPSKYTEYSVASSPYKNGAGDIVKEMADACQKAGLKFGVYLSPWDRHEPSYGKGEEYNCYFLNQLEELLSDYGNIFCVWFDGANGEGENGKVQTYDWKRYYETIRRLQPNATIHVCGPDVRWCGNEAGHVRKSEWSVVPEILSDKEKIAEKSQQEDNALFRERINNMEEDLGSRNIIKNYDKLIWYPAEVNNSIRPNWFYNSDDNDKVRSLEELMNIYYGSVGGNASFLLNIPPDKRGKIHENDRKRLIEMGQRIKMEFSTPYQEQVKVLWKQQDISFVLHEGEPSWIGEKEEEEIHLIFESEQTLRNLILMEDIRYSQRVEEFELVSDGRVLYHGTTIGYKKICSIVPEKIQKLTIRVKQSRQFPTFQYIGVYLL